MNAELVLASIGCENTPLPGDREIVGVKASLCGCLGAKFEAHFGVNAMNQTAGLVSRAPLVIVTR